MVEYVASEERISKFEGELKRAVDQEAEKARQLDTERTRRAALNRQLHEAREEAIRLVLEEGSRTRNTLLAEAEEILQVSGIEVKRQADQITRQASDEASEMIAAARREAMAFVDAGREEVRALEDDAPDLDTKHRELTHRLGVMETIYDELVATLKLVAEFSIEGLIERQDSLKRLDLRQTQQRPTEPNGEQTTSRSAPPDELLDSERVNADRLLQEPRGEADRLVHDAPAEASREQDQLNSPPESVPEPDDDGGQELAVILDDRDVKQRRSRYQRWLNLNREDRASKENRARQNEAISERFSRVLSSGNGVDGADPQQVEARIRNLSHGTNSQ